MNGLLKVVSGTALMRTLAKSRLRQAKKFKLTVRSGIEEVLKIPAELGQKIEKFKQSKVKGLFWQRKKQACFHRFIVIIPKDRPRA